MHWYPWVKAFHIMFVISWYAGLLYLPRLFVYHTMARDEGDAAGQARFAVMERKLFAIMSIGFAGAALLGVWLAVTVWPASGAYWLHIKFALLIVLIAYHGWCHLTVRSFRRGNNTHSQRYFRLMNEVPALLMVAIVILVVVKPI